MKSHSSSTLAPVANDDNRLQPGNTVSGNTHSPAQVDNGDNYLDARNDITQCASHSATIKDDGDNNGLETADDSSKNSSDPEPSGKGDNGPETANDVSKNASPSAPVPEDDNGLESGNKSPRLTSPSMVNLAGISDQAKQATNRENNMTFRQGLKLFFPGVFWSLLLSTTVIMEGYDLALITSFYALEQFCKKYGGKGPDGKWVLPAPWKAGLTIGALAGEIIGLFISGIASEKYGYRKTMVAALCFMIAFIFVPFFAPNVQTLLAGQILCGIPWGIFQTLPTAYASEVVAGVLRPYLCTYINLCWIMGQMMAAGIICAMLFRPDEWAYRIPLALQWLFPIPVVFGVIFAPESPWWLVRKGRIEEAKKALLRLTTRGDPHFSVDDTISLIHDTNEHEKQISEGMSYLDCFKGVDLRRTEISCVTWLIQAMCGSVLQGYSTLFYKEAGLSERWAFNFTLIQFSLGVIGTFASWFLMSRCGRRTLYLYGCSMQFLLLLIIGLTGLASSANIAAQWSCAILLLLFTFVYGCTVGPVCFALVAELSSTRLKTKTIVLARNCYNIGSIIASVLTSYQLTPKSTNADDASAADGWGWGAMSALFWAGSCAGCILWIYIRLPEPKKRSYVELDTLFEMGVSARKFATTNLSLEIEMENIKKSCSGNETGSSSNRDMVNRRSAAVVAVKRVPNPV